MWTVKKTTATTNQDRQLIDPACREALMRVWDGSADPSDEVLVRALIEGTHAADRWIACDCRMPAPAAQALMAPAFLRTHRTHYLRRLYGKTRERHADTCPFYGEPALGLDKLLECRTPDRPAGYFAVPDHAAAPPKDFSSLGLPAPDLDPSPKRGDNLLRRQLWRLMERARLHIIYPPVAGRKPSYKFEYAALKDAADELHVAYGTPLSRVFDTVPTAFERKSIYAKIRQAARHRRDDVDGCRADPLQGWVCFFARDADADEIRSPMKGETIAIRPERGVDVLPGGGPYLALVCVSADEKGDLRPVRGVAQPILSMRRFFPVYHENDRAVLDALTSVQFDLRRNGDDHLLGFDRALFGGDENEAPGRLTCLLADGGTGALHELSLIPQRMAGTPAEQIVDLVRRWALDATARNEHQPLPA